MIQVVDTQARLREHEWFIQIYARSAQWRAYAAPLADCGAKILVDHWGGPDCVRYADLLAGLKRWLPDRLDQERVLSRNPERLFGFSFDDKAARFPYK